MKQTLQNRFPRRWLLLAFVLNFAIAAAALLPYMIRDGVKASTTMTRPLARSTRA